MVKKVNKKTFLVYANDIFKRFTYNKSGYEKTLLMQKWSKRPKLSPIAFEHKRLRQ